MEGMMMWDDDEQYVPPNIVKEFINNIEKPAIFGNEVD